MNKILLDFKFQCAILVLLAGTLFFGKLGTQDLPPIGSCIYASIAKEMVRSGDWLTPHWPGCSPFMDFYQHPPLLPWLTAACFRFFGTSDRNAVVVSASLGFCCVLLTLWLGYLLFDKWTGYFAALIASTTPLLIKHSRDCELESALVFFVTLAFIFFVLAQKSGGKPGLRGAYFVLFGISTGLASLAKGPPAFVAYPVVLIYIFLSKQKELLKEKFLWVGFAAGMTVPFFWIVPQIFYRGDRFYEKYVLEQIVLSIKGRNIKTDEVRRVLDFFYFFPAVLMYYLPWGAVGCYVAWKKMLRAGRPLVNGIILPAVWVAAVWAGFSLPGYKENSYLLAAWPAWSVTVAYYLRGSGDGVSFRLKIVKWHFILLAAMLAVVFLTPVQLDRTRNPEFKPLGVKIRKFVPEKRNVYVYRLYYWDMAALFAWYVDRGVTAYPIECECCLEKAVNENGREKFIFLKTQDYRKLGAAVRRKTRVLCGERKYILVSTVVGDRKRWKGKK